MRKSFVIGIAAIVLVATPLTVLAVSRSGQSGGAHINCMATRALTKPISTGSTTFKDISSLRLPVEAVFGLTESVTVVVKGAPVRLKAVNVEQGGTFEMAPGTVTMDPTAGATNAFSFTFVSDGAPALHAQEVRISWRVLHAGDSATMVRAVVSLVYEAETCPFI